MDSLKDQMHLDHFSSPGSYGYNIPPEDKGSHHLDDVYTPTAEAKGHCGGCKPPKPHAKSKKTKAGK